MISNEDDVYVYIYIFGYVYTGAQSEIFQGRGGLVGLGHFYKHFVKNTKKKKRSRREKFGSFFLLDPLKLHFESKI